MGTLVLEETAATGPPEVPESAGLGSEILVQNVHWFMRVRSLVVAVFVAAALTGTLARDWMASLGLTIPTAWLLVLGVGLAAANTAFFLTARRLSGTGASARVRVHLWLQIAIDMVAVTVLVHAIGSGQTFISFIYLFHISLACIFFPKRHSILVVAAASALYLAVVALEVWGVWPSAGLLAPGSATRGPGLSLLAAGSAVAIWAVVWYLVSTLSDAVRKRDLRLAALNEHLVKLDREKNMQMLLTTHELKVPFSGIRSNIDVLRMQHGPELPQEARDILDRIDARAGLLSERISEMLYLGDLKSAGATQAGQPRSAVDLGATIGAVIESLEPKTQERRVRIESVLPPVCVHGNPERYRVLVANLLSNAIVYSQEGGSIRVELRAQADGASLVVTDQGIGIREDALSHIFEEFFRTKEAARFNKLSSGLGLAIVREIARQHRIRVRVTSQEGQGTTFEVVFPDLVEREGEGVR